MILQLVKYCLLSTIRAALHAVSPVSLMALHVYMPVSALFKSEIWRVPESNRANRGSLRPRLRLFLNHLIEGGGSPLAEHWSMATLATGNVWFCGPWWMIGGGRGSTSVRNKHGHVNWAYNWWRYDMVYGMVFYIALFLCWYRYLWLPALPWRRRCQPHWGPDTRTVPRHPSSPRSITSVPSSVTENRPWSWRGNIRIWRTKTNKH